LIHVFFYKMSEFGLYFINIHLFLTKKGESVVMKPHHDDVHEFFRFIESVHQSVLMVDSM